MRVRCTALDTRGRAGQGQPWRRGPAACSLGRVPASGCRSDLCCPEPESVGLRGLACSLALGKWLGQRLIESVNLVRLFTESF